MKNEDTVSKALVSNKGFASRADMSLSTYSTMVPVLVLCHDHEKLLVCPFEAWLAFSMPTRHFHSRRHRRYAGRFIVEISQRKADWWLLKRPALDL